MTGRQWTLVWSAAAVAAAVAALDVADVGWIQDHSIAVGLALSVLLGLAFVYLTVWLVDVKLAERAREHWRPLARLALDDLLTAATDAREAVLDVVDLRDSTARVEARVADPPWRNFDESLRNRLEAGLTSDPDIRHGMTQALLDAAAHIAARSSAWAPIMLQQDQLESRATDLSRYAADLRGAAARSAVPDVGHVALVLSDVSVLANLKAAATEFRP